MKKVVATFGRLNPTTTGHMKLMDKVVSVAKKEKAPYKIYLSHTHNKKKDPLVYKDKLKWARLSAPKYAKNIIDSKINSVLEMATELYDAGYTDLKVVMGGDRISGMENLVKKYNGVDSKHGLYEFDSIEFLNAGERDEKATDVSGMSASKLRAAVTDNDFETFSQGVSPALSDKQKQEYFDNVKSSMGIKESRETFSDLLEEITKKDLDNIEKYADKFFAKVGVDIEFTKHFLDRVNDKRNSKPISSAEMIKLFKDTYKQHGKKITELGKDAEAVIKDMRTDINVPFVLKLNKDGSFELISKTVMRKKGFKTSNKELKLESVISKLSENLDAYRNKEKNQWKSMLYNVANDLNNGF